MQFIKHTQVKNTLALVCVSLSIYGCGSSSSTNTETSTTPIAADDVDFILSESSDAQELGIMPGDIVCLDGSITYNKPLLFENFIGTEEEPIIITNCNGLVHINPDSSSYGWKFQNSKYFKILGNGDPSIDYGIKVSTQTGFYLTLEYFSTNVEVAFVEIAGTGGQTIDGEVDSNGFAGMGIKTSPYQDCELFQDETKSAFIMEDVSIHDNYIHGVGGEGIYAGHGFYQGRQESSCPDNTITYAHNIHNLSIYNNIITDVGYDGIQIKNADSNALVYGNVIRNFGMEGEGAHDEGIFIGDGFEGVVHSNWVENGPGHGFQVNAFGNTQIYNNIVVDVEGDGFYINNKSDSFANRDGLFQIYHNTLVNMGDDAVESYLGDGQDLDFANNILVNYADEASKGTTVSETNIFDTDINNLNFIDPNNHNFGLTADSIAIDAGLTSKISSDFSGTQRNDQLPDIGAFEYLSDSQPPQ